MANYILGIDFGTSQTKVCVYNETENTRKLDLFPDGNIFLPSVIVEDKFTGLFQYGKEISETDNYNVFRYFKMAAAEDVDLIQRTYQDKDGKIEKAIDDYRKYSNSEKLDYSDIQPEVLVILYISYVQLYLKQEIESKLKNIGTRIGGFLQSFFRNADNKVQNSYFISLGIPTEWNNPNHIKRKAKFQSLLLISKWLTMEFEDLDSFLQTPKNELILKINQLSENLNSEKENSQDFSMDVFLRKNLLAVFSESAAGLYYLLGTNRLVPGLYSTLDIGAGTSDIAMIEVTDENEVVYYCSETVAIASNDFFRSLAESIENNEVTFEKIQEYSKKVFAEPISIEEGQLIDIRRKIRGDDNWLGVEGAIMKMFYKPYIELYNKYSKRAKDLLDKFNNDRPILLFGGGSRLIIFDGGKYSFFYTQKSKLETKYNLIAEPISKYVNSVDVQNPDKVRPYIHLLILALGLTYVKKDSDYVPFEFKSEFEYPEPQDNFEYYDLKYDTYR